MDLKDQLKIVKRLWCRVIPEYREYNMFWARMHVDGECLIKHLEKQIALQEETNESNNNQEKTEEMENRTDIPKGYTATNIRVDEETNQIVYKLVKQNPEPYNLFIEKINGGLGIKFLDEKGGESYLGVINKAGECFILNDKIRRSNYKIWVEKGMKIDSTEVEWKGKNYSINKYLVLQSDKKRESIYDFKRAMPCSDCQDENIVRWDHNEAPILF